MNEPLLQRLSWRGETLSGSKIYRRETHQENILRNKVSLLSFWVGTALSDLQIPDDVLVDSIKKLQVAYSDPFHLGGNIPNSYFDGGKGQKIPTVPNPRFDYWEFLGFAITGEGGFKAFEEHIGLSPKADYSCVCGIVSLLLLDSAITYLNNGDYLNASSEVFQAHEAWDEMLSVKTELRALADARRAVARAGGRGRHAETDEFKAQLLANWDSGFFNGNKSEAARWALRQFPLSRKHGDETVKGWIRKHEKTKAGETD